MIKLGVKISGVKETVAAFRRLQDSSKKATRDAINDTAKHLRTLASSDIRARWNVKKRDLDKYLTISARASLANLRAELSAEGISLPLALFSPKAVSGGVQVSLHKGKLTVVSGAFMATMKSGHTGVFRRPFKSRRSPNAKPYRELPVRTVKSGGWAGTTYRPSLPVVEAHTVEVGTMWVPFIKHEMEQASGYLNTRLFYWLDRYARRRSR